ncbi:MAG: LysM peptidoglycan-binding domain-containing protein [Bradymonadia bacterium]
MASISDSTSKSRRPSLIKRLFAPLGRFTLHLSMLGLVTLGGGVAAAVLYDWAVPPPQAPRLTATGPGMTLPPAEPEAEGPDIDPLIQAVIMARADMPPLALVDVQPRIAGGVVFLEGEADSRKTIDQVVAAVGRVPGVIAVDARAVELAPRLHVVAKGDTLIKISKRYYGSGGYWPAIKDANTRNEGDRVLKLGETILIPPIE